MSFLALLARAGATTPAPVDPPTPAQVPTGYAFHEEIAAPALASGVSVTDAPTATGTAYPWDSPQITRLGLVPSVSNGRVTNALSIGEPSGFAVEFLHDGTTFDVEFGGASGYSRKAFVWVDGKPTAETPVIGAGAGAFRVTFATPATRTILVEIDMSSTYIGFVGIRTNGAIAATNKPRRRVLLYGDSWIQGTGGTKLRNLGWLAGRYLDADAYYHGLGGTAYGTNGSGPNDYAADWRIAQVTPSDPHEVVVCGSINSGSNNTEGAALFYQKIAKALPRARIIVIGRQSYGDASNDKGVDADIKAAADAAPNVIGYVSPRAEKWITGTGDSLSGTGQAALYHNGENRNHLTAAGNLYYAEMTAKAIARILPVTAS